MFDIAIEKGLKIKQLNVSSVLFHGNLQEQVDTSGLGFDQDKTHLYCVSDCWYLYEASTKKIF